MSSVSEIHLNASYFDYYPLITICYFLLMTTLFFSLDSIFFQRPLMIE